MGIRRIKFSETLYSGTTEIDPHASQINSSSLSSFARLYRQTVSFNVPPLKMVTGVRSSENGDQSVPVTANVESFKTLTLFSNIIPREGQKPHGHGVIGSHFE
ncbi:hypothetical protein AVEN_146902-1 [Araneus ventricosus]|uniref:Uncharacterized protein n=1 Tax=Araneus ventricosus TaxID=182803 RepID=A0A4Y2U5C8_ARAVE|nr:hypothetical protein AVEN_146902-1 [Araneus ventricosus]